VKRRHTECAYYFQKALLDPNGVTSNSQGFQPLDTDRIPEPRRVTNPRATV
jgi:hypothetical protein